MSIKDPIQAFVDEITLLRNELADLKRTSLSKDEAAAINKTILTGVERMSQVGPVVQKVIQHDLAKTALDVRAHAVEAAQSAAREAIEKSHAESLKAAKSLSQAAGEARRQAWRYFGGFWVWLTSVGATGALLGALMMFWLQGRADAHKFGDYPNIYCRSAGGEIAQNTDGRRFCGIWIDPPAQQAEE
ncbi:hypothetical protein Q9295_17825 [Xinfangfangia sp. CPCC 101601]|uniref:Mobilization protein MobX n=1 Tax=Pseudogemmobacter lacusdianii TaxID=3069608 RepID=A0ABU0W2M9_9RHOB|nr:hypothetical protein [Xinfangfangia sp. CPCC 101601]MDQ2068222.1 hypothetical protein [Xinfangfangia sp. CPCC 101601]